VANIKSQIKRNRQNEARRLRNKAAKSEIKTRIKTAVRSVSEGSEDSGLDLRMAVKRLDKAVSRGIIHKNQAANRKSALMRQVNQIEAANTAEAEADAESE
jgi:small subunit ribosomal protein S20